MNCTQDEPEVPAIINDKKSKDNQQDLFEFRASEENVIRQSSSNQGSIGSQQSICSAEEVNPESENDAVFEEDEDNISETQDDNALDRSKMRYGNRINGRSISLSDDATTTSSSSRRNIDDDNEHSRRSISTSASTSYPQSPPKWIPDHVVGKCMSCESQFTAFRRRHHCRNCGK
jgi:lateral signaling target protein 2